MKVSVAWMALFAFSALYLVACNGSPAGDGATATSAAADTRVPAAQRPFPTVAPVAPNRAPVLTPVPAPLIVIPTPLAPVPQATTPVNAASAMTTQVRSTPLPLLSPAAIREPSVEDLRGRILFFTDREGSSVQLYVMDADGSGAHPCNCSAVLQAMVDRDKTSPDQSQFLFVKAIGGSRFTPADVQIWSHNNRTGFESAFVGGAPGFPGVDYEPAWSPDSRHVAWVSEIDGNDEIYLHDSQTNEDKRLTVNDKAWDKHPSFSPDGARIAFWSNRESALKKQIWLMSVDGTDQHNISNNAYNDYDPLWVK